MLGFWAEATRAENARAKMLAQQTKLKKTGFSYFFRRKSVLSTTRFMMFGEVFIKAYFLIKGFRFPPLVTPAFVKCKNFFSVGGPKSLQLQSA